MSDIIRDIVNEHELVENLRCIEDMLLEEYKNSARVINYDRENKIHDIVMGLYIDGYFARAFENNEILTISILNQWVAQYYREHKERRREQKIRNPDGKVADYSFREDCNKDEDFSIERMIEEDEDFVISREEYEKVSEKPDTEEYWREDPERIELFKETLAEQTNTTESLRQQALNLFPQLIQKIVALPVQRLHRFCAAYFWVQNYLDCMVDQSYTELKNDWKGQPIPFGFGKLNAEAKREFLLLRYMPLRFWQDCFYQASLRGTQGEAPILKENLSYNSWENLQEKYERYHNAFSTNVWRDWNREVEWLLSEVGQVDEQFLQALRFELLFCTGHKTLRKPNRMKTEHDAVLAIGKDATCCKKYEGIISLFVQGKIFGNSRYENDPLWLEYKRHRDLCMGKCQRYEVYTEQKMIRRYSRLCEDLQRTKQFFYPDHQSKKNNLQKGDKSAAIKEYYEKVYDKKPSDLYQAYLEILSARKGKSFKPTAKSQKEHKNRGSKLGYTLETRCMCGAVNRYTLNALRFPLVTVGRQQEDGVWVAHINLCADEERKLSTHHFYFKYDTAKGDWMFGIGSGNTQKPEDPEKLKALALRVLYMPPQDLFNKLDDIKTAGGDKVACEKALKHCWKQLGAKEQIPLSEIALIRVVSSSGFKFQGEKSKGVYHPIFGLLENTAWLLEINANRADQSIIASAIEKSVLAD